jgi:long-subunit acyl-CoA synthetase (AMP-forming)
VCSFSELRERVLSRAEELRTEPFKTLGILADGSFGCVTEIFASATAGRRTVMLSENASEEVLAEQVREAGLDALWGDPDLCEELSPCLAERAEGGSGKILFFTSGTTSRAKAVVLTDSTLMASAYNGGALLPLAPEDTLLCMLPLDHVFGFVCGLLWGLSCGACVARGRGARHYHEDCAFFRPTALSAVPALLGFLLKNGALNRELKTILIGAGGCPPDTVAAAKATGARVCFGYGLTETSSGVALSVGGDPYAMDVCPEDIVTIAPDGEILVSVPSCMMKGYYKQPEATRDVLINGVLLTGDLGRFDKDGRLHITGRKKDMLVLADGTKIFLPEYEAELTKALGRDELAVVLRGGRPVLVLYGNGDKTAILRELKPLMADYPRGQQLTDILFTREPFPRTATGKLKRWELQQKAGLL